MLQLRRNHGTSSLRHDATRAGSRIAEDALGVAQTARDELGGLGREVRDQAATGVTRARRRTARGLESAASAVDETPGRKGRRRKPLLLAVVAGLAGWVAVKLLRANGPQTHDAAAEAEEKAVKAQERVDEATERVDEATERVDEATDRVTSKVAGTARKVADEADKVGAQANARTGSNAKH